MVSLNSKFISIWHFKYCNQNRDSSWSLKDNNLVNYDTDLQVLYEIGISLEKMICPLYVVGSRGKCPFNLTVV